MTRKAPAYLCAVAAAYLTGTLLVSQFNIARITELGFDVTLAERVQNAVHDLTNMYDLFLPLVAVALLIAFLVTAKLVLRRIDRPALLYPLAGFVAMLALHGILYLVFGMSPVAPTRTLAGLLGQGLAGALGGYVFFRLTR